MNKGLQGYEGAERTDRFRDSDKLNGLLQNLASLLKPVQRAAPIEQSSNPIGCIVGPPRSGTTLFQQWLASLGVFSYPTNLLTRFAYAPYVGALIQKMLFDPDFDPHGEFHDIQSDITFDSDLGKSKGTLACNEFQHFFRNYMPNFDLQWLNNESLKQVDCEGILQGLASIESAFGKPFTTKANILQFNISYMAEHMSRLFWIHIEREPIYNMQSIILARERYYGNRETWLSAKPKQYTQLKDMDVYHQIAGQVYFTNKAIRTALQKLAASRWISVQYESFCKHPEAVYKTLCEKYDLQGCDLPREYTGIESFNLRNEFRLPDKDIKALNAAYSDFICGHFDTD